MIPILKRGIQINASGSKFSTSFASSEILGLCKTLEFEITSSFYQTLEKPNPTYYIGRGKVMVISEFLEKTREVERKKVEEESWKKRREKRVEKRQETPSEPDYGRLEFAVFDCMLKPNQIFNLEKAFHVRVFDRNSLILMIFFQHARTNEAKLQVEYAILKHQIPYITELVRRAKLGEHPGFLASGEYKVDDYFKLTKKRIKKIQIELIKIKNSRKQRRNHRRRFGFELATLAGYTNAGKSALLKALTDAKVVIDDRMFSTLSTKTRRFRKSNLLITDTVGFIQDIPPHLFEAFKSTLEEIIFADHILLIVDISEDIEIIKTKIKEGLKIIDQLICENYMFGESQQQKSYQITRPTCKLVFNKSDLEPNSKKKITEVQEQLSNEIAEHGINSIYLISCKTLTGVDDIIREFGEIGERSNF